MKRVVLFSLIAAAGFAAQAQRYIDPGRVERVVPQYENTGRGERYVCQWVPEAHPMDNAGIGFGTAILGSQAPASERQECRTVRLSEPRLVGYQVTYYDARGRQRTAFTREHPGEYYRGSRR